jgi:hypothetical protein
LQTAFSGSAATLHVCPGTYQGGFSIGRTVTVIGAGQDDDPASNTILDGNDTQRVLAISSGQVALQRLRIQDGNEGTDYAGGILHSGGSLTMHDCTVTANNARSGGGIVHASGTLAMTRCTVSDNTAPEGGGAADGGGCLFSASATLTDCQITGNTTDGVGGGIHITGFDTLTLAGDTIIQGNTAGSGGGIFSSLNSPGSLIIGEACRITGNTAVDGEGGGVQRSTLGQVILEGTDDPSPIVVNNCHENCAGVSIPRCAATPVNCPP